MTWQELLQSALTLAVAFGVRWALALIGVQLSEDIFVSIVAGIVVYLLGLFGVEVFRGFASKFLGGQHLFHPKG